MSTSIKEKLTQYYLNFRKSNYLHRFNKGMPKKTEKKLSEFILKDTLNNQDEYCSYKLKNNIVTSFVFSKRMNDYGENILPTEMVIQDGYITKSIIEKEIIKIKLFYKDKDKYKKIVLPAYSTQNKLIQLYNESGFSFTGNTYLGQVTDALKYYSNKNLLCPQGVIIRTGTKTDLTKIFKLARICHGSDKTSRINRTVSSFLKNKEISDIYKKSIRDKSLFVITRKSRIIGYIVIALSYVKGGNKNNTRRNTLIGDIGVHPDYWGNGLANILYNQAFQFMKSEKIKIYLGSSSTKSVMNLSKKLNRKSFLSVYYIDI